MNVAILAGGMGKRFGGAEKSQIVICGKKIIDMLMERFSSFNTIIVCRDESQKVIFEGYRCIFDEFKNSGPLGGIHAALRHFNDFVAVIATDMPFVKVEVVEELYRTAVKHDVAALIPCWKNGKLEPLLSVYSPKIVSLIEKSLEMEEKKILTPVFKSEDVVLFDVECLRKFDKKLVSFFNINTPEDLERAEEICLSTGMIEK